MSSHKEEASPRGSNSCLIPGRLQMNWQMDFFFFKKNYTLEWHRDKESNMEEMHL